MDNIFKTILDTAQMFMNAIGSFTDLVLHVLTKPFTEILFEYSPAHVNLLATFLNTIGLEEFTLFELMIGVSVPIYIVIQFIKWIIDIVT